MRNEIGADVTPALGAVSDTGRFSRRRFAAGAALAPVAGLTLARAMTSAQSATVPVLGDTPTTGETRPGPTGMAPSRITRNRGIVPSALMIDRIGVEAMIEIRGIVDRVMQNPTGPFVVSWYEETARLAEEGNVVMAGHVDYWSVGEAVFWDLKLLEEGDEIVAVGDDGALHEYKVTWSRPYTVADLTPEVIQGEIVGPTPKKCITLITCDGSFDAIAGSYPDRLIVRAELARVLNGAEPA